METELQKPTLGHIDCPHCFASKTMRITHDRNDKPFGHCDDCNGQLRVGGNSYREKKFVERYPFSGQKSPEIPVTVTEPEKPVLPVTAEKSNAVMATVTDTQNTAAKKQKASFADALAMLGGGK